MPFAINPLNRVIAGAAIAVLVFAGLAAYTPLERLIIVLNGVFAGTMAAITVAYWRLMWNAVLGIRPYDRVRQMTLGFALCWAAFMLGVANSIYFRSAGVAANAASLLTAASLYVAIIAAVLQVTAPDFGLGIFHGRDRKVLAAAIVFGLIVASAMILSQQHEVLAEQGPLPLQLAPANTVGTPM